MIGCARYFGSLPLSPWKTSQLSNQICFSFLKRHSRSFHCCAYRREKTVLMCSKGSLGNCTHQEFTSLGQGNGNLWCCLGKRNLSFYRMIFKKKTPDQMREKDGVPHHYDIVYMGKSANVAVAGYGIVQGVLLFALCGAARLSFLALTLGANPLLAYNPYEVGIFASANLLFMLIFLDTCRSCVLRIYYSELEDNFILVNVGLHPFATTKMNAKPGEISPTHPSALKEAIVPWANDVYTKESKKLIITTVGFEVPYYLNKLLGYEQS